MIAHTPDFDTVSFKRTGLTSNLTVLGAEELKALVHNATNYWQVIALNAYGNTASVLPPARFTIDPTLTPVPVAIPTVGPDGLLVRAELHGTIEPGFGKLARATQFQVATGKDGTAGQAVQLDGKSQKLIYGVAEFPEDDFSVALWVQVDDMPLGRVAQAFSAWCASMDDPLRLCVDNGRLFARIEAGQTYATPGVAIEPGRWYHVAAVKARDKLTLFVNGQPGQAARVPSFLRSGSEEIALGGNPRFPGNEHLAASFADFRFYARALSEKEVSNAANRP